MDLPTALDQIDDQKTKSDAYVEKRCEDIAERCNCGIHKCMDWRCEGCRDAFGHRFCF